MRSALAGGLLCAGVGAFAGYAGALAPMSSLARWLTVMAVTYSFSLGVVLAQGVLWMRAVAEDTGQPAAISFDLGHELVRVLLAVGFGAVASFLPSAAPFNAAGERQLSLVAAGAACGAAAIILRLWPANVDEAEPGG